MLFCKLIKILEEQLINARKYKEWKEIKYILINSFERFCEIGR